MKPLAIDLFCGLGGWTDGFLAEGYDVIGFDIEQHVYGEHRYPAQLVLQDVRTLHGSQFKDAAVIVASSPCQKYSYMAMPWTRAKTLAKWYREAPERLVELNELFEQPRRIQREASEAAGRHIPMIQENVKGAQPWVGRAQWHYGSYYLWGDVPALMPMTLRSQKFNPDGSAHGIGSWFAVADSKNRGVSVLGDGIKAGDRNKGRANGSHQWTTSFEEAGQKNSGASWFNIGSEGQKQTNNNPARGASTDGVKGFTPHGQPLGKNELGKKHGSKSKARKAASARIAKIPFPLAQHIAYVYRTSVLRGAA